MPFQTMDGLLKDGTYRFAVVGDSADFSFFQVYIFKLFRQHIQEMKGKSSDAWCKVLLASLLIRDAFNLHKK